METLKDLDLVRAISPRPELIRSDSGEKSGMPTMVINFSTFDEWYEINSIFEGRFLERTVPGAFRKTIRENGKNVKVLFDHGHDYHIGNKVLGPIRSLSEEATGPVAEVELLDTSYNRDLLPGLEAGLYGSSFRFQVVKEEWDDNPKRSEHNPQGIPERTIKEVKLFEFGPVTFPANPASTSAVRGLTDDYYGRIRQRNPEIYEDLACRAKELRRPERIVVNSRNTENADDVTGDDLETRTSESVETPEAATPEQEAAETRTSEDIEQTCTSVEEAAVVETVEPPALLHSPTPKGLRRARLAWINSVIDGTHKKIEDFYHDGED